MRSTRYPTRTRTLTAMMRSTAFGLMKNDNDASVSFRDMFGNEAVTPDDCFFEALNGETDDDYFAPSFPKVLSILLLCLSALGLAANPSLFFPTFCFFAFASHTVGAN
jgi:hypothetical protein